MKIAKIVGIGFATLVVLFVAIGFMLPKEINVERDITLNAPPAVVFENLNSFKKFNTWSPWASRDPNTKYTYTGPETGVGAKMKWESEHPNVGMEARRLWSRPKYFGEEQVGLWS